MRELESLRVCEDTRLHRREYTKRRSKTYKYHVLRLKSLSVAVLCWYRSRKPDGDINTIETSVAFVAWSPTKLHYVVEIVLVIEIHQE
jgi:hypothetical protein